MTFCVRVLWLAFYFALTWLILGANKVSLIIVAVLYACSLLFSLSYSAEVLHRFLYGARPLRTSREIERLEPILKTIIKSMQGGKIAGQYICLCREVRLYIKDTMDINAFSLGRESLVLTKGAIHMLNDEDLQGIIAHELGHFACKHPLQLTILAVGNLLFTLTFKLIETIGKALQNFTAKFGNTFVFPIIWAPISLVFRAIEFIGDLILMSASRRDEYEADYFAFVCGMGDNLIEVLYKLDLMATEEPMKITDYLRRTHPPLTSRIRKLERQDFKKFGEDKFTPFEFFPFHESQINWKQIK